jgi:hypothetical protein
MFFWLQRTAEQAAALGIPLSVLDDHPKVLTRVLPFLSNLTRVDDMRSIIKTLYKDQETQKARILSGLSVSVQDLGLGSKLKS